MLEEVRHIQKCCGVSTLDVIMPECDIISIGKMQKDEFLLHNNQQEQMIPLKDRSIWVYLAALIWAHSSWG